MLLVTRPNYDQGTNYLYYWSKLVIDEANERSKAMLLTNLGKILSSNSNDKEDTARWIYHDYCSQVVYGNGQATL